MSHEELRDTFIDLEHCANLRAIETNSNCYNKNGNFKPDDIGHIKEISKVIEAGDNCVKIYQKKKSNSRKSKGIKKGINKYQGKIKRRITSKRKQHYRHYY